MEHNQTGNKEKYVVEKIKKNKKLSALLRKVREFTAK